MLAGFSVPLMARAEGVRLLRTGTVVVPRSSARQPFGEFDLSYVDPKLDLYLVSDVSNRAIDAFRATTGRFLFQITGFKGRTPPAYTHVGPTGVITVGNEIWASDADSTVRVINLRTRKVVDTISTGGVARCDTLAYDAKDRLVLVTNPDDVPRFITLISTKPGHRLVRRIRFQGVTGELEAAAWSPVNGMFYLLLRELNGDLTKGAVAMIDPRPGRVVARFPIDGCRPSGIALDSRTRDQTMLVGCLGTVELQGADAKRWGFPPRTIIMDARNGAIVHEVAGISGSDEVWYNPGDDRYYVAAQGNPNGPIIAAIDASPPYKALAASTQAWAHSVAVDPNTDRAYVPFAPQPGVFPCQFGCIAIYAVR
jgi:DNA-binding beta-propeller fold protein YncE